MMSLSSGWSGGPGYSSAEHKLTWYSGLGWPAFGWACSSAGAETVSTGPRTLHLTWCPLWTHIPYLHPLCACALFHVPIPTYSRTVYSTLQCLCPCLLPLYDHSMTLCPSLAHCHSPMPVLCPPCLMPALNMCPSPVLLSHVRGPKLLLPAPPTGLKEICHQP